jgi:hypothetical protein
LIVCISKKNLPVPATLPLSLQQFKVHATQQQQQQPPPQPSSSTMNQHTMASSHAPPVPQTIYQPTPPPVHTAGPPPRMDPVPQHPPHTNAPSMMHSTMSGGGGGGMMEEGVSHGMSAPPATGFMMSSTMMTPSAPTRPVSGMSHPMGSAGAGATTTTASFSMGPPPLAKAGGISISDAFEGLDSNNNNNIGGGGGMGFSSMNHYSNNTNPVGDTGSISSYRASTPVPGVVHETPSSEPRQQQQQPQASYSTTSNIASPKITMNTTEPPVSSLNNNNDNKDYVSSYDMGDSHVELKKLREALQKLQAENISLKASMGTYKGDEDDVQKELNATIAQVTKLSQDLTQTRAQVLASKSRLLEATMELKAAKEKLMYVKCLVFSTESVSVVIFSILSQSNSRIYV